jgi:hypothetical protein
VVVVLYGAPEWTGGKMWKSTSYFLRVLDARDRCEVARKHLVAAVEA